jgi:methylmalonyl-CoA mutase
VAPYRSRHRVRVVTAASLFDGHDASINVMRRILQATGAEVIHLGHNRSVDEVATAAIQEDVQAIAISSYQGGHNEYFRYLYDTLRAQGAGHIRIFGGGGGTILPSEIEALQAHGIARIYHPDDGRSLGLQGMINDILQQSDFAVWGPLNGELGHLTDRRPGTIARLITLLENDPVQAERIRQALPQPTKTVPVLGITGTGGAGKSSLTDELVRRFLLDQPADKTLAILSVDPTRRKTGGALLGDRIRMNAIFDSRVYMRSLATREDHVSISRTVQDAVALLKAAGYDLVIVETAGIGQSDAQITDLVDASLYVMTPEFGAASQLEKIAMLDYADLVAINKFDKRGAQDALRDVRKQFQRNHQRFADPLDSMPVFGTIASQFNDPGVNRLYRAVLDALVSRTDAALKTDYTPPTAESEKIYIIPPDRTRYLAEIAEASDRYETWVKRQAHQARQLYQLEGTLRLLEERGPDGRHSRAETETQFNELRHLYETLENELDSESRRLLNEWPEVQQRYRTPENVYSVRGKEIRVQNYTETLSHLQLPKVALPRYQDWGDILHWRMRENVPGQFPYTSGVFPYRRTAEDPTRMFAGEGGPERTNKRFHYLAAGMRGARLSTAFDSVTLYGEDPAIRPDIYGKIGNSGVSVASLDDAKKLYSGFDLCDPLTSVSMTINGPAPMLLAYFLHAAIDQQCELFIQKEGLSDQVNAQIDQIFAAKGTPRPTYNGPLPEGNNGLGLLLLGVTGADVLPADVYQQIRIRTLQTVRGTVQADILKEDQAQNTCIFSTEFALRLMGDIQQYFIDHSVRNFYSVSISGYHIAEAGANPITQLAFTLANGFTYVEYYRSRGMDVSAFAPNLSFFFSNGMDPEYAVIGRVARRLWAKAMRNLYGADSRSQMLKYHIQTSGRSLHAQEIAFNDIRTTLQALYAYYDNCNSLHTNAYDEAITTPTEESVRRAVAIQLIMARELGLAKNENPLQGSFIIEELTDLVEEAVYSEFRRLTERGGVLGAMETMYQRNQIQEESLYYETLKHDGTLPVIGVNTYLDLQGSPTIIPSEVIRSTDEEKDFQIGQVEALHARYPDQAQAALRALQQAAVRNLNTFAALLDAAPFCSLGQISAALYQVGGQYRRNM